MLSPVSGTQDDQKLHFCYPFIFCQCQKSVHGGYIKPEKRCRFRCRRVYLATTKFQKSIAGRYRGSLHWSLDSRCSGGAALSPKNPTSHCHRCSRACLFSFWQFPPPMDPTTNFGDDYTLRQRRHDDSSHSSNQSNCKSQW